MQETILRRLAGRADGGLLALAGAALLGRAGHVLLAWDYFAQHPEEAARLDLGGICWQTAVVGALIGLWMGSRIWGYSFGGALAGCAPLVGLVGLLVWGRCAGACGGYGAEVDTLAGYPPLVVAELPDRYGIAAPRWNTPLMGAGGSALALAAAVWLLRRGWGARAGWAALWVLAVGMVGVDMLRPISTAERALTGAVVLLAAVGWRWGR